VELKQQLMLALPVAERNKIEVRGYKPRTT